MASTGVSRIEGIDPAVAQKAPCAAAATGNITLSGAQTIDGVAVAETTPATRVLAPLQTDGTEGGIWDVKTTAWTRSEDFDGNRDVVTGTLISVVGGTANGGATYRVTTADPITIGASLLTFVYANVSGITGTQVYTASYTTMDALPAMATGTPVTLTGEGISGDWVVDDAVHTANIGTIRDWTNAVGNQHLRRIHSGPPWAEWFEANIASADNTLAIQNTIDYAITLNPIGPGLSTDVNFGPGNFIHTGKILRKGSTIVGSGITSTRLQFKNVAGGTGMGVTTDDLTLTILYGGFRNLTIFGDVADGPDVSVDITGGSYATYDNFNIQNKRPNGALFKGVGNTGASPYYNSFSNYSLFGGVDGTQTGCLFDQGTWAGGSNGPNANVFSNLKRGASLSRLFDIRSGFGNLGTNISAESIFDAMFVFNDIPVTATGTASSGTQNTLVDSSATYTVNEFLNAGVRITAGTGSGQARLVATNTATTLTVNPVWGVLPDATSVYEVLIGRTSGNKFTSIRQEGLASQNPDFIRNITGSRDNSVDRYEVQSLGTGKLVNDEQNEPTNKFSDGDLTILSEVVSNIGPGANLDIWPKVSVLGGVSFGRKFVIEYLMVSTPNHSTGNTTVTLDAGGAAVGGGSPSLEAIVTVANNRNVYVANLDKSPIDSTNVHSFLNITTDGAVSAVADYMITAAFRVLD